MMDEFYYNLVLLVFLFFVLAVNLWLSSVSDKYWWFSPNGFVFLPIFLSSVGFPVFFVFYGRYPELYGVELSNIALVNGCFAVAALFYTLGTLFKVVPNNFVFKDLRFEPEVYRLFRIILGVFLAVLCVFLWVTVISSGGLEASSFKYGEDQWSRVNESPWLRFVVLLVPLFAAFLVIVVLNTARLPWLFLISMAALIAYPAIKSGGRKDLLFLAVVFIISNALRVGKNRIKTLVIYGVVLMSINYIQVVVRENFGSDLGVGLSAVTSNQKDENGLIGQIATLFPVAPTLSSAMLAFPSMQDYGFGFTYFETVVGTLVPKIISEDFNYGSPNQKFHELYYPEVTDFSMDYSLAAESYQNFGIAGIFVGYFLFGALVSNAYRVFRANLKGVLSGLYVVFLFSAIWAVRSDSNTFLKTAFYPSVVLVTIFIASKLVARLIWFVRKNPG